MTAQEHRRDVFDADAEFHGEEGAVAGRVEDACLPDDPLRRESGHLERPLDHGVEGIADDDHDCLGACVTDLGSDIADDLGIRGEEIVAAHARLAGDAGGHDDDVTAGGVGPVGRASEAGIEPHDRRRLEEIERLAGGHALGRRNVEQNDVSEFGGGTPMGRGGSDVTGTDDGDLRASHGGVCFLRGWRKKRFGGAG